MGIGGISSDRIARRQREQWQRSSEWQWSFNREYERGRTSMLDTHVRHASSDWSPPPAVRAGPRTGGAHGRHDGPRVRFGDVAVRYWRSRTGQCPDRQCARGSFGVPCSSAHHAAASDDAAVGIPWGTPGVLGKRPGLGGGYSRAAAIVAPAHCPGPLKVTGRTTPTCRSRGSSND